MVGIGISVGDSRFSVVELVAFEFTSGTRRWREKQQIDDDSRKTLTKTGRIRS